jgi:aspartyl-tRNA(Asn)/glutamyl-tRNA(Gln) amidotransferase subunit A
VSSPSGHPAGGPAGEALERCLERIDDPRGEGSRTFLHVAREPAREAAAAWDRMRAADLPLPPLAGVPISVKDLFDVQGETTAAGSRILGGVPPATRDAVAVERLRRAGAVIVGRTNMTEFAFSGVGMNPHFGTPRNPWDRESERIPGGSSSGAAVSVADGMATAALGTDTGGSCRIPAALCGLVGFKPTASRIPQDGVVPLSPSLDTVGTIARSVEWIVRVDAVLTGAPTLARPGPTPRGLRFLVPEAPFHEGLDEPTARAFEEALGRLSATGASLTREEIAGLGELPRLVEDGGIAAAEGYAWHERFLLSQGSEYDPRVRARFEAGGGQSAADHIRRVQLRARLIEQIGRDLEPFDAVLAPTTPIVAPPLSAFQDDEEYHRLNRLLLRNPSVANLLDGCSISLPCQAPGEAPVGLMLIARGGEDRRLLSMAGSIEQVVRPASTP